MTAAPEIDIVPGWCDFGYTTDARPKPNATHEIRHATFGNQFITELSDGKRFKIFLSCSQRATNGHFARPWSDFIPQPHTIPNEKEFCAFAKTVAQIEVPNTKDSSVEVHDCVYKTKYGYGKGLIISTLKLGKGSVFDFDLYSISESSKFRVGLRDYALTTEEAADLMAEIDEATYRRPNE